MISAARVNLWGTTIGTVSITEESGIARFEYDRDFLQSGIQVSPIVMPLSERIYSFPGLSELSFHGLPGLLADSLPDKFGNAVIDAWLVSQGRDPGTFSAVERLCYTGTRGMGALEFQPAMGGKQKSDPVEIEAMVQLASDILTGRESLKVREDEDAMNRILQIGTSAGGARAKAVIAWNRETGEIRSGQVDVGEGFTHWLIKFDGVAGNKDKEQEDGASYCKIEYAYYLMAQKAGINMNPCQLYEDSGRHHFVTKRFDRIGAKNEKLHMQTLGAMAHYDYNVAGANSYEQAASVMRKLGLSQRQVEELFRRMTFNIMARNQDDHVKNLSFLMDKSGTWSLAPAYDVTYSYNPGGLWTGQHQMSMNGKRDGFIREDFYQCGGNMSLRNREVVKIMEEVSSGINDWSRFAEEAGLDEKTTEAIAGTFRGI